MHLQSEEIRRETASSLPTAMRALTLTDGGPVLRTDYPVPTLQPGEALIRVRLAGICGTDLALLANYKGGFRGVLGHEFVGEVVAAPDDPTWVGRRVVGEINVGCGRCSWCRHGLERHCPNRQSIGILGRDGTFADYLALPLANLHPVPDDLPDQEAVFTEPLAAACEILEQIQVTPNSRVYVLGDGRLGLLVAQVLALTGCDLTVVGHHPQKLAVVAAMGIQTCCIQGDQVDSFLQPRSAHVVVEAVGSARGFALARHLVRPRGTVVLKSTFPGAPPAVDLSDLVVNEIRLVGSRCGPFPPALRHLARRTVQVAPLIHDHFPLAEGLAALERAGQRGVLKVLLSLA